VGHGWAGDAESIISVSKKKLAHYPPLSQHENSGQIAQAKACATYCVTQPLERTVPSGANVTR